MRANSNKPFTRMILHVRTKSQRKQLRPRPVCSQKEQSGQGLDCLMLWNKYFCEFQSNCSVFNIRYKYGNLLICLQTWNSNGNSNKPSTYLFIFGGNWYIPVEFYLICNLIVKWEFHAAYGYDNASWVSRWSLFSPLDIYLTVLYRCIQLVLEEFIFMDFIWTFLPLKGKQN